MHKKLRKQVEAWDSHPDGAVDAAWEEYLKGMSPTRQAMLRDEKNLFARCFRGGYTRGYYRAEARFTDA